LAIRALVERGAERGGATGAEVPESLPLAIRQGVAPALEKLRFVLTKHLGDSGPRQVHWDGVSPVDWSKGEMVSASKGLATA
jgi:hypothetical protein